MHDAWTKMQTHYMAMFACYVRPDVEKDQSGQLIHVEKAECTLISISPILTFYVKEGKDTPSDMEQWCEQAVQFDAETVARHARVVLQSEYLLSSSWLKCIVADNCPVHLAVSRLLEVPHVACRSHLLACDVRDCIARTKPVKVGIISH